MNEFIGINENKKCSFGAKADNLMKLKEAGFLVPPFLCLSALPEKRDSILPLLSKISLDGLFAVRSSSNVEDGGKSSFAGQFDTYLFVPEDEVMERIRQVFASVNSPGVIAYCKQNNIPIKDIRMTAIVQKMIPSEYSGVLFTANPQGLRNESVVVVGKGTGNLVVEDKAETTTYYYNNSDRVFYFEQTGQSPILSEPVVEELISIGTSVKELFHQECDIEFAICKNQFYLLQARPITTFNENEETIILDNSNIVESYPGITLPLSQSFIRTVYYRIFRAVLNRLTKQDKIVKDMDKSLQNMVDVANGRVYYRISNWYDVIMMLPFRSKIIPVWQEMLGVQTKSVSSSLDFPIPLLTRLKVGNSFFSLLRTCPKKMSELDGFFNDVLKHYQTLSVGKMSNEELMNCYYELLDMVMDKWDITLVNDMFTFIYTGLLKASLKKREEDYEVATREYISQIAEIESLNPIREMKFLKEKAVELKLIKDLSELMSNQDVKKYLAGHPGDFQQAFEDYIENYGDRSLEELKLESKTFRTDPILLVSRLVQSAQLTEEWVPKDTLRKRKIIKGFRAGIARKAALGIRNREKSRLNRGRLYGMMRELMIQIGQNLEKSGVLEVYNDVFWLYEEELLGVIRGESFPATVRIAERKKQYEMFRALPAYSRLVFAGKVTNKNACCIGNMKFDKNEGIYCGIPCSQGIAEGEVLVVENPGLNIQTKGKILVTKMTDPGWVFLIAQAKGIIAERGSLLSHTAIVSRELGKPAVVNVKNITKYLKNGDRVRIDGNKGEITII